MLVINSIILVTLRESFREEHFNWLRYVHITKHISANIYQHWAFERVSFVLSTDFVHKNLISIKRGLETQAGKKTIRVHETIFFIFMDHSYRRCYHYKNIGIFILSHPYCVYFFLSSENVSNAICPSITVTSKQELYGQTTVHRTGYVTTIDALLWNLFNRKGTHKNYLFYENGKWISYWFVVVRKCYHRTEI